MVGVVEFLRQYRIERLVIQPSGDIRARQASEVSVQFGKSADEAGSGYRMTFKLLQQGSDCHLYIKEIVSPDDSGSRESDAKTYSKTAAATPWPPGCDIHWTQAGQGLDEDAQKACLARLLAAISGRVEKVFKEQSILNIQPVGKSFRLMGKTRFEVLSDDGNGQLQIRIHREDGVTEAGLNANDLLDGLHSGLISRD